MIKLLMTLPTDQEALLEEILWALGALSVGTQPPHVTDRSVEALFDDTEQDALEKQLREAIPALDKVAFEAVQEQAWQETWRDNFKPLDIGSFKLIGNWEEGYDKDPKIIRIYPGMAFGTGQHETTQLLIEKLETMGLAGKKVLDAGCGTGILSIVAERLGAASVFGFDIDPDCKENMELHLEMNETSRTKLAIGTVDDFEPGKYDLILANIIIAVLKQIWPTLKEQLAPGALLLSSGILREQEEDAVQTLTGLGFQVGEIQRRGDWITIEARLP